MIVLGLRLLLKVSAMRKKWHLCQCLCIHFILSFCARTKNSSEKCSNRPPLTESSQYIYLKNLRPRHRRLSFTASFIEVCFSRRGLGCVACAVRELQYCSALAYSTLFSLSSRDVWRRLPADSAATPSSWKEQAMCHNCPILMYGFTCGGICVLSSLESEKEGKKKQTCPTDKRIRLILNLPT